MGTSTLGLQTGRSGNLHGTKMIVTVKCRGLIYIIYENRIQTTITFFQMIELEMIKFIKHPKRASNPPFLKNSIA